MNIMSIHLRNTVEAVDLLISNLYAKSFDDRSTLKALGSLLLVQQGGRGFSSPSVKLDPDILES